MVPVHRAGARRCCIAAASVTVSSPARQNWKVLCAASKPARHDATAAAGVAQLCSSAKRVRYLGLRVYQLTGVGFRVQGFGSRVQDFRFGV